MTSVAKKTTESISRMPSMLPQVQELKEDAPPRAKFSPIVSQQTYENLFKDCEPQFAPPPPGPLPPSPAIYDKGEEPSTEEVNEKEEEEEEEEVENEEDEDTRNSVDAEWVPPRSNGSTRQTRTSTRTAARNRPSYHSEEPESEPSTTSSTRSKKRISGSTAPPCLPRDAPIQPRTYHVDSRTSLKPVPKLLLQKHEQALEAGAISKEALETEAARRRRMNTLNARESRRRKAQAQEEKIKENAELREENESLRNQVGELECENEELRRRVALLEEAKRGDQELDRHGQKNVKRVRRE
ncbi:hypothetical protein JCM3765_007419 [Sporobolomyces pararoseus]